MTVSSYDSIIIALNKNDYLIFKFTYALMDKKRSLALKKRFN